MGISSILLQSIGLEAIGSNDVPQGDYSPSIIPPARSDAPDVSVQRALSLPAVYRSIQISAGMAAQLDLGVWRNGQQIPTPTLISTPDPWRPLSAWIERVVVDLACDGNAFLRKVKNADGRLVALPALNPFSVRVYRDKANRKKYDVALAGGKSETLDADEVLHLWGLEVPGQDRGLSPIAYCRLSLSGALDTRDFAATWFDAGHTPPGTLSTDKPIDGAARKEYQKAWHDGPADQIKVMGNGLKFEPIMITPEDAQWIEAQKFNILDIARLFGVPAAYLLAGIEGSAMTYQNLEQVDAQFLRTTLFPVYLRKIEAALTEALPYGQVAKFDTSELLRPDSKARMEIHKIALEAGVYDDRYARKVERISEDYKPTTPPTKAGAAA